MEIEVDILDMDQVIFMAYVFLLDKSGILDLQRDWQNHRSK